MEKTELINDIISDMLYDLEKEQRDKLKIVLTVRLKDYDLVENKMLPSTDVKDNEWAIRRFQIDCAAKGIKQSSIKSYVYVVEKFLDMTHLSYAQVTGQDITDYLAVKQYTKNANGEYPKQNYIAGICRDLFVFFQWAYKKHHIDRDIMLDVDRIKGVKKKKDRLTPEEIETCRDMTTDERESALLELMISTGMRVGEIAKLKICDINLTTREIHIPGYKSATSDRDGVLSIKARNALKRYIGSRTDGYVFISKKTKDKICEMSNGVIESMAKHIGKRAGAHLTTTVHVYRKTFASELFRKTHDIKLVSIALGHTDTRVTEQCYLIDDIADIKHRMMAAA